MLFSHGTSSMEFGSRKHERRAILDERRAILESTFVSYPWRFFRRTGRLNLMATCARCKGLSQKES